MKPERGTKRGTLRALGAAPDIEFIGGLLGRQERGKIFYYPISFVTKRNRVT